ncbi:hypothetical protein EVAR_103272_1 [Eumeta japonica]|uniref:Uncharacterized protein n=1 Tax=Eumeta variegata TaxID=151549 RepID=A0A4C1XQF3_EUMVA|nr:hypothetical protein EVAR_103272_1 [Eumeta japonica]
MSCAGRGRYRARYSWHRAKMCENDRYPSSLNCDYIRRAETLLCSSAQIKISKHARGTREDEESRRPHHGSSYLPALRHGWRLGAFGAIYQNRVGRYIERALAKKFSTPYC